MFNLGELNTPVEPWEDVKDQVIANAAIGKI
jgi:hypothetical protein